MKVTLHTYFFYTVVAAALLFSSSVVGQFAIPPKPKVQTQKDSLVYDYIKLLSKSELQLLNTKLNRYEDSTSTQIVIAIIGSSNGDDLGLVGAKWGQEWGIGQADEDNGILIILAKDDRKIDINTGYGIEYRMSDRTTEQIINRIIIPQFKSENFYAGLDQGTDAIFKALEGEFTENRNFDDGISIQQLVMIFLIFFVIMMILRRRNKGNGSNNGSGGSGGSLLDVIILSNMGRTGGFGGSGGFGGGGFGGGGGSFGGGGFGGGGASGGW